MIKIQLDIHALEKLFPVGTDAYFHFQNAVIAEASKRFTKGLAEPLVRKVVNESVRLTEVEIGKELGLKYGHLKDQWGYKNVELVPEVKKAISDAVSKSFDAEIKDGVDKFLPVIESRIDSYVANNVRQKISTLVCAEIELQLKKSSFIINKYLLAEMEKIFGPR